MLKYLMTPLLLFSFTSQASSLAELSPLKLAIGYIPHIQFAPLYVAQKKGFFKKRGINLSIQYGFGLDIYNLLLTEQVDVGLSDSDQLVTAISKGLPIKSVYQYYQEYPLRVLTLNDMHLLLK